MSKMKMELSTLKLKQKKKKNEEAAVERNCNNCSLQKSRGGQSLEMPTAEEMNASG